MGTFPAMPAGYMYDMSRDGTIARWFDETAGSIRGTMTSGQIVQAQSMDDSVAITATAILQNNAPCISYMFPDARALTGAIARIGCVTGGDAAQWSYRLYGSNDTVDGVNGTWSAISARVLSNGNQTNNPLYRTPVALSGMYKAVKVRSDYQSGWMTLYLHTFQLFGTTPPPGLCLWDPTSDAVLGPAGLDHGDLYVGAPESIKTFRIKNLSSATANNVTISINGASDYGSLFTATSFDVGGGYQSSVQIASIAPGAISPVVSMKRAVPVALAAGTIEMAQVQAIATSWT